MHWMQESPPYLSSSSKIWFSSSRILWNPSESVLKMLCCSFSIFSTDFLSKLNNQKLSLYKSRSRSIQEACLESCNGCCKTECLWELHPWNSPTFDSSCNSFQFSSLFYPHTLAASWLHFRTVQLIQVRKFSLQYPFPIIATAFRRWILLSKVVRENCKVLPHKVLE